MTEKHGSDNNTPVWNPIIDEVVDACGSLHAGAAGECYIIDDGLPYYSPGTKDPAQITQEEETAMSYMKSAMTNSSSVEKK